MRRRVRCFYEDFIKTEPYTVMDAGLRVIELKRVVGTIDKCGELDDRFRYIKRRDNVERSRRYRLEQAAKKYAFFPPIEVDLYRGNYYVVDGHRRVAASMALKIEFIDAHVLEYVHKSEGDEISGALLRRRFESETGLRNVNLSVESGYGVLLEEVKKFHGEDISENPKKWYSEIFLPACSVIRDSQLLSFYPELNERDIFVLIAGFYNDFMDGIPAEDFEAIISGFMFAHSIPEHRRWRNSPFRLLGKMINRRGKVPVFPPER
jgi:hypothetical protein